MASNSNFFYSKVMPKIYGIGAAVVILGAMFKILDWQGANWMIGIGLSTEAVIFFLSAFEPSPKEVDWSKVYPELDEEGTAKPAPKRPAHADGVAAQLDEVLFKANIGPELIESLGKGMANLASSAERMGNLADAAVATTEYATQVKAASKTLASMNESYAQTAAALMEMSSASQDAKAYQTQIQLVTKNLAALNAVYELELQDTAEQKKARSEFYKQMSTAMSSFTEAGQQSQAFKEELIKLNQNVGALSKIYGGMLSSLKG